MKIPFGKHRGTDVATLPDDYVAWLHGTATIHNPLLRAAIEREYVRRFDPPMGAAPATDVQAMITDLITSGYRSLARRCHPDVGGQTQSMQLVNAAYDQLRQRKQRCPRCGYTA